MRDGEVDQGLVAAPSGQWHQVSADTVGGLLREEGFSLQAGARASTAGGTRTAMPSPATSTSSPEGTWAPAGP